MKPLTDTEKAFTYLTAVERDVRKFLQDGEGINPFEYFEDVHIALVEAMELLGVKPDDSGDEPEFDDIELEYEGERRYHAADLENFDPITHLEAKERTGEMK